MKFQLQKRAVLHFISFVFLLCVFTTASAKKPYGAPISFEQAKIVMAKAEATAKENNWNVVISIVDSGGHLVMLHRLDTTQFGSVNISQQKAETAVAFRRPTAVFQELIAKGGKNIRLLNLNSGNSGVYEGGVPIIVDGKIIGGIGVSGVASSDDAIIAQAGADSLLKK